MQNYGNLLGLAYIIRYQGASDKQTDVGKASQLIDRFAQAKAYLRKIQLQSDTTRDNE